MPWCRPAGGQTPFILALADIDRFKEINDGWGHQMGDAFLQEMVRSWTAKLQEGEILARLGGDEFACLFCRSLRRLKLLRQEVEQDLAAAFAELPVGLSLGYARFQPRASGHSRRLDGPGRPAPLPGKARSGRKDSFEFRVDAKPWTGHAGNLKRRQGA